MAAAVVVVVVVVAGSCSKGPFSVWFFSDAGAVVPFGFCPLLGVPGVSGVSGCALMKLEKLENKGSFWEVGGKVGRIGGGEVFWGEE